MLAGSSSSSSGTSQSAMARAFATRTMERSTRDGGASTPPPAADASAQHVPANEDNEAGASGDAGAQSEAAAVDSWWAAASVVHGTCGWTDESLARSSFFPPAAKTSLERLRHYASRMPCVEVDTSTYAIPSSESTARWASVVPDGFVFHVKLFGVFCGVGVPLNALPRTVREMPCMAAIVARGNAVRVGVDDLPGAAVDMVWSRFHEALQPLRDAGKLGAIVVQFQNSFWPSSANRRIVEGVRRRLDGALQIALELRCRGWFAEAELPGTLAWMRSLGRTSLVAADDLKHETLQPDRAQTGPPAGSEVERLLIALHVTDPRCMYVRVHRRQGEHRMLAPAELGEWVERLRPASLRAQGLRGPVWFLWGNAHSDQPIRSANALAALLRVGAQVAMQQPQGATAAAGSGGTPLENSLTAWQRRLREAAPKTSVLSMLRAAPAAAASPAAASPAAAAAAASPAAAQRHQAPRSSTSTGSGKKRAAAGAPADGQRQLSAFFRPE